MGKFIKYIFILLIIAVIGIQFIKVDRTNPPVIGDIKAPDEVKNIFKKACYDCHSNETKWPWYSHVAPVSWIIEDDVSDGRRHLNFSEWENYKDTRKSKKRDEIWDEVKDGDMPIKMYTYLHPQSNLDINQKNIIKEWATKRKAWE